MAVGIVETWLGPPQNRNNYQLMVETDQPLDLVLRESKYWWYERKSRLGVVMMIGKSSNKCSKQY